MNGKENLQFGEPDTARWRQAKEIFLDALEIPETEREKFIEEKCADDSLLKKEVEELLAAHFESESFIEKPLFEVASIFKNKTGNKETVFGNYRIIREIGVGGMGAVYLAERSDGEFNRQVAIKIVRQNFADKELINRFKRERQILASLSHPFIAKLLDGGADADGVPFLAMEYIDGEPITEYASTQNLSVEERLNIFLKVCAAVAEAHRNLIVHRDLKPSNIFVTDDGTPKLLDFGLAKLLDAGLSSDEAQTLTAFRAMTPAYASPEQLRGKPITTSSDIYSLGVVLYELLTGDRPFHFKNQTLNEMIEVVCNDEPTRPSDAVTQRAGGDITGEKFGNTIRQREEETEKNRKNEILKEKSVSPSRLKGDLDNIILTAMMKEPDLRYPTVEKFAEDIERHLKGLPVRARPNTFSYRTGKFIKRHYWGTIAGLVILLTLLGGIVATLWQSQRAEQQRLRAEKRFNDVRRLSNALMFEIHDSVQNLQGSTPTRQLIVNRALEYLDSLAQESGDDATLQRELATAYDKIGDILGNPYLSNLGDTNGALQRYRQSLAIRESLSAADPQNVEIKREVALSYDHLSDVLGRTGGVKEAIENLKKSIAVRTRLISENPNNRELRRDLAGSQVKIGEYLQASGDLNAGIENEREALAIFESLAAENPQDAKAARMIMVTNNKIGYMLYVSGDLSGAMEVYRKGLEIGETLAAKDLTDAKAQRDLSFSLNNIGRILLKQKDAAGAEAAFNRSFSIAQKLSAADPQNSLARSDTAYALVRLGAAQAAGGKYREAIKSQQQAIDINNSLIEKNPKNLLPSSEKADSYTYIGEALEKLGDKKGALENYQQATTVREKTSATEPSEVLYRQAVAESYQTLGRLHAELNSKDARSWYERSLEIWRELNSGNLLNPTDAENITLIQKEIEKLK